MPTKLAAYKKVLSGIKSGIVDPEKMYFCQYREPATGLQCGVGILFNDAQLNDILERGLNEWSIRQLANVIGVKNIETVTGLSLKELDDLQTHHDTCCSNVEFEEYVRAKIKEHSHA